MTAHSSHSARRQAAASTARTAHFSIDAAGWATGARIVVSPNADVRPDADREPSLLVIHNISLPPGQFGTGDVEALFTNTLDFDADPFYAQIRGLKVSSHFLIGRDGVLTQFVSTLARAWHAGVSSFEGRERCNDFSVGVELEGCDDRAFEAAQYRCLGELTRALRQRHPLLAVVGHEHIAPGRKTDPGPGFDWQTYAHAAGISTAIPGPLLGDEIG